MGDGLPTIGDVARLSGVSPQTVSNVLNSPHIVSDSTRDRVQKVIDDLGYRPNSAARRLRTRASSTIGVRIDPTSTDGVSGAALDRFLHLLTQQAEDRGLRVLLFTATSSGDEIAQYVKLRDTADVDAIVVTSTVFADPRLAFLRTERLPFVAFGRPWGSDQDDPLIRWVAPRITCTGGGCGASASSAGPTAQAPATTVGSAGSKHAPS
jgi:DNA-binding LacI/PurR family transcriptional regulator